jgi:predicted nucleotidyltransferase
MMACFPIRLVHIDVAVMMAEEANQLSILELRAVLYKHLVFEISITSHSNHSIDLYLCQPVSVSSHCYLCTDYISVQVGTDKAKSQVRKKQLPAGEIIREEENTRSDIDGFFFGQNE